MRIWPTFATWTVQSFCQTNLLPLLLLYRHWWMARLGFNFLQLIGGWRHILRIEKSTLSATLLLIVQKNNSSTLNRVNYNYWTLLGKFQIVIKHVFLIYQEPVWGGSSYTRLQLVPSRFYNITSIRFHSNAIGGHLNPYCKLLHIQLCY